MNVLIPTETLEAVREALELYAGADDGAVQLLAGFKATSDMIDHNSPARSALTLLDAAIAASGEAL